LTYSLFLACFWSAASLCTVAVYLGRSAPATPVSDAPRRWASPPLAGINLCTNARAQEAPFVLDLETGAIVPDPLPDVTGLDLLGFSPWRDAAGQTHLIARPRRASPARNNSTDDPCGLLRYAFPSGRLLDRVSVDTLPIGTVCWCPDQSDRILFGGADGRLYLHDFAAGLPATQHAPPVRPRPLEWQGGAPGSGPVQIQNPCWPAAPELGGLILASITFDADDSPRGSGPQLWWLRLDPDTATIAAAGRVIVPDRAGGGTIPADEEERLPCVARARDGRLMLAYLTRDPASQTWDLWVAPIAPAGPGRAASVLRSRRRKLAGHCIPLALAFSADGRSVYVSLCDERLGPSWGTLRRYPVADGS
jgi:hypothetical protein